MPTHHVEVYDILSDAEERHELAASDPALLASLMEVAARYNATPYVDPLISTPPNPPGCQAAQTCCPMSVPSAGDPQGVLTPCE